MAKFIKSIFQYPASETRKSMRHDGEVEGDGESPIEGRRNLSMSRSGRLKQAYKKRHSLSMELYGTENDLQHVEKPKSKEYHVNAPKTPTEPQKNARRKSIEATCSVVPKNGSVSPDEEIDSAFEVIDKS